MDTPTWSTTPTFRTQRRKIIGDSRKHWGRSLLVVLSITIGVFGVTTMMSMTDLINQQLAEDIQPRHIAHTHAYVFSTAPTTTLEENRAYLDNLRQVEGVTDVEGQAFYPVTWQSGPDATPEDGILGAFTEPFGSIDLEPPSRVVEGRYPKAGEVVVEQRFALANNLGVGDFLLFETTGEQQWPIVGTVIFNYFSFTPAAPGTALQAVNAIFTTYEDAQAVVGFPGLSGIQVRFTDNATSLANDSALAAAIGSQTPYVIAFSTHDNPDADFVTGVTTQVTAAMDVLGIIAMLVSGLLVTNVMNTIIVEQRQQIGIMKSLGASYAQVFLIYAAMALLYGALGTALGLALALPASALAVKGFASWVYIDGFHVSLMSVAVGAIMGLVVPVLAALLPVWNGTRVSILEAITDRGIDATWGQSALSRRIGGLHLPTFAQQAVNNLWHKKWRLTLTGLTLTAATAAFMGATAMDESLDDYIWKSFGLYGYHIQISPQQAADLEPVAALIEQEIEGVEAAYVGFSASVGVEGFTSEMLMGSGTNQVGVYGFDPATTAFRIDYAEGTGWQDDPTRRGLVMSRSVADALETEAGADVTLSVDGQAVAYPVVGIADYHFDALFMDWRELAWLTGYTAPDGTPLAGIIYVRLTGSPSDDLIDQRIADIKPLLSAQGIHATYVNQPEVAKQQAQQADMIGISFQFLSVVMGAVGAVGLMAVLSMAVFERQKEIGIMRSVGAQSRVVMGQFMLEGVLISLVAWVIALPLSVLMGLGLIEVLPFAGVTLRYAPLIMLVGMLGVVVIAALASLLPALAASRKTVADILRYQ